MCLEDIRLGRQLAPLAFQVTIPGAAWTRVLDADPMRTRILFSNDGNATLCFFPEKAGVLIPSGFVISNPNNFLEILVEKWGRLVEAPWFCATTGINPTLSVMVATLEKQ